MRNTPSRSLPSHRRLKITIFMCFVEVLCPNIFATRTNHDFNHLQQSRHNHRIKTKSENCVWKMCAHLCVRNEQTRSLVTDADEMFVCPLTLNLIQIQLEIVLIIGYCHFERVRSIHFTDGTNKKKKKCLFLALDRNWRLIRLIRRVPLLPALWVLLLWNYVQTVRMNVWNVAEWQNNSKLKSISRIELNKQSNLE